MKGFKIGWGGCTYITKIACSFVIGLGYIKTTRLLTLAKVINVLIKKLFFCKNVFSILTQITDILCQKLGLTFRETREYSKWPKTAIKSQNVDPRSRPHFCRHLAVPGDQLCQAEERQPAEEEPGGVGVLQRRLRPRHQLVPWWQRRN
jgi:hypothetical protein